MNVGGLNTLKKWLSVSYYMHSAKINYHCISYRISCLGLEAATQSCSMKKLLLKHGENLQENTHAEV